MTDKPTYALSPIRCNCFKCRVNESLAIIDKIEHLPTDKGTTYNNELTQVLTSKQECDKMYNCG